MSWVMVAAVVTGQAPATGQEGTSPQREVEVVRQLYQAGKFKDALERARAAMGVSNFDDRQRVALQEIAGLSAYTLGDQDSARNHFLQLLKLEPDHQLDPFAVAPAVVRFFEQVRTENAAELSLIRQQIVLREEAAQRARAEEEERRRREEGSSVLVRTIERRPLIVNFLPFGAGQFQQGRVALGVGLAVTEAVLALTSIIAYLAINALYEPYTINLTDRLAPDGSGRFTAVVRRIPTARQTEYTVWSFVKYITGGAFYAAWAAGSTVALVQHRPDVVTETQERPRPALTLSPMGLGLAMTVRFP